MNTALTRELAYPVLHAIGKHLDSTGLTGTQRAHAATLMYHTVADARNHGLIYDGGPWMDFVSLYNTLAHRP